MLTVWRVCSFSSCPSIDDSLNIVHSNELSTIVLTPQKKDVLILHVQCTSRINIHYSRATSLYKSSKICFIPKRYIFNVSGPLSMIDSNTCIFFRQTLLSVKFSRKKIVKVSRKSKTKVLVTVKIMLLFLPFLLNFIRCFQIDKNSAG